VDGDGIVYGATEKLYQGKNTDKLTVWTD